MKPTEGFIAGTADRAPAEDMHAGGVDDFAEPHALVAPLQRLAWP